MEDIKQKVPFYGGYTKIYTDNEYFEVLQTEKSYKTYFGWYTKVKFQKLRTETGVKYVHAVAEERGPALCQESVPEELKRTSLCPTAAAIYLLTETLTKCRRTISRILKFKRRYSQI